jgi:hypothetical protein
MGYDSLFRVSVTAAPWDERRETMSDDEVLEELERECARMRDVYKRLRAETHEDYEFPEFGAEYRGTDEIASILPFTREFPEFTFRFWHFTFDLLHLDVYDIRGDAIKEVTRFDFESQSLPRELEDVGLTFGIIHNDSFIILREITDDIVGECAIGFDCSDGW